MEGNPLSDLSQFLRAPRIQEFTSSGTFTRPTGVDVVYVTLVAGGAGGAVNIGGGGGQVCTRWVPISGDVTVTIGAGGSAGGGAGGTSTFGSAVTAYGGSGRKGGGTNVTYGQNIIAPGSSGGAPGGIGGDDTLSEYSSPCAGFGKSYSSNYDGGGGSFGNAGIGAGPANTGAGGTGNTAGGSGYCTVMYWE